MYISLKTAIEKIHQDVDGYCKRWLDQSVSSLLNGNGADDHIGEENNDGGDHGGEQPLPLIRLPAQDELQAKEQRRQIRQRIFNETSAALSEILKASILGKSRVRMVGEYKDNFLHLGIAGIDKIIVDKYSDVASDPFSSARAEYWYRVDEPMTRMIVGHMYNQFTKSNRNYNSLTRTLDFTEDPGALIVMDQHSNSNFRHSLETERSLMSCLLHSSFQGKPVASLDFVKSTGQQSGKQQLTAGQKDSPRSEEWMNRVHFSCRAIGTVRELMPDALDVLDDLELDEHYFDALRDPYRRRHLLYKACKLSTGNHTEYVLPLPDGDDLYVLRFSVKANKKTTSWSDHWRGYLSTDQWLSYVDNYAAIDPAILVDPAKLEAYIYSYFNEREKKRQQPLRGE